MRRAFRRGLPLLVLPALLAVGCADGSGDPLGPEGMALSAGSSTLVECPTDETRSVSGVLGLLGGTLSLDGHSITLPVGAVLTPTPITLTVPESRYMEVEITANDAESFTFQEPVEITISYARCSRSNIDGSQLTVWQIDPATKELLEHMGGEDDKASRAVTFGSGHLSGFAIAN